MGTAAVAYIALLASRLPWFLGGAAPATAGAGYYILKHFMKHDLLILYTQPYNLHNCQNIERSIDLAT